MIKVKLGRPWRWALFLGVLACSMVLILLPQDTDRRLLPSRPDVMPVPKSTSGKVVPATPDVVHSSLAVTEIRDPFAPRSWVTAPAPDAPAPAPVVAAVVPLTIPVAPVGPPTLPYQFMGQMDDGGKAVMYLSRANDTFVVRPGDTLEGTYRVLAMDPRRIEFEHIPTGTKQVLLVPAS